MTGTPSTRADKPAPESTKRKVFTARLNVQWQEDCKCLPCLRALLIKQTFDDLMGAKFE